MGRYSRYSKEILEGFIGHLEYLQYLVCGVEQATTNGNCDSSCRERPTLVQDLTTEFYRQHHVLMDVTKGLDTVAGSTELPSLSPRSLGADRRQGKKKIILVRGRLAATVPGSRGSGLVRGRADVS